jgi:hypothetical protein
MELKTGDDIPESYKRWWNADLRHTEAWRKEARTDYEFRDGHQFSDDELRMLEDQQRPPTVFNRIGAIIDAVSGQEISNRLETTYIPREEGDVKPNELLTSAALWFRDQADADDNESEAFRDTITCGMGWTETRIDHSDNPDGDMVDDRIDPFEMVWDYNARKQNLVDASRVWRVRKLPIREAREFVKSVAGKEYDDDQLHAGWAEGGIFDKASDPHVSEPVRDRTQGRFADSTGELTEAIIVHCQWIEREDVWRVPIPAPEPAPMMPPMGDLGPIPVASPGMTPEMGAPPAPMQGMNGAASDMMSGMGGEQGMPPSMTAPAPPPQPTYKDMNGEEYAVFKKQYPVMTGMDFDEQDLGVRKRKKKVRYQAFLGNIVLKVMPTACPDHFNFQCVTGKRDQIEGQWYGIVRAMRDPQAWSNKLFSQILHIINSQAKGGIMAEKGTMFDNDSDAQESWARTDRITFTKPGALGANPKWAEKPVAQTPPALPMLMEFAGQSIHQTSGVNLELMGQREADQAGVLEYQRRQAGLTILQPLFDAKKAGQRTKGELYLYYIQNDLSDGRLIKILGKSETKYVRLIKEADKEYDIIVSDSPTSPNQKEKNWQLTTQILPMVKEMLTPPVMLALLEDSPLPTKTVQKLQELAQQASQSDAAKQQERMAKLENDVLETKAMLQAAQAQKARADAQAAQGVDPQQELMIEQQKAQGKLQIEAKKADAQIQISHAKAQGDMQVKAQTAQMDGRVKMQTAQQDAQIAAQSAQQDMAIKGATAGSDIEMRRKSGEADIALKDKQAKAAANRKPAPTSK